MFKTINNCIKYKQLVFPQFCLLCQESVKTNQLSICTPCMAELPWLSAGNCCPHCGLVSQSNSPCGHCLKSPPTFDATHALFAYGYPIDAVLQQYKYGSALTIAELFGQLLVNNRKASQLPDLLIPMPLHPQRLAERGFNQAVEIARIVAHALQLPLDTRACRRVRFSAPQATLPLKQRVKNMRNAFSCERKLDGLKVALLDDVMTTGASLNALATAVKKAGAATVECWVIARTQPQDRHV